MRDAIGSRVGAISHVDIATVHFFGYGVYDGDHVPPADLPGWAGMLGEINTPNPRITLDNGKHVYGCECWWGPEDKVRERIAGCNIIIVDIDEARKGTAS